MPDCVSDEQLVRLHAGDLSEVESASVNRHLSSCATCSSRSESLLKEHQGLVGQLQALHKSAVQRVSVPEQVTRIVAGGSRPLDDSLNDPAEAPTPSAGTPRITGYQIVREIHRGGQGVIYQAVQLSTKRKVAIKVLLHGQFASKASRRRFEREVELASALKHPNIISIFDSSILPDGQPYYVMDYVRGLPLDSYVKDKHLNLQQTLELMATVCEAVSYAHQKGVIHRDLKPSNILVDVDGQPRVLDFGLAKMLFSASETMVSMTGEITGTLQYMSPEQARGTPDEIDTRSDVYSLGVILYQGLTGQFPYPVTESLNQVLNHIVQTPPNPPSRSWKSGVGVARSTKGRLMADCPIDSDLETIVLKALAKERERRYQSAGELAQDIHRYLRNEPIEARRDSGWYVARKFLSRYRVPVLSAVVLFLLLSVFSAGLLYAYQNLRAETEQLQEETDRAVRLYTQFFEGMYDGVMTFDAASGLLVDANTACLNLFRTTKEEFVKKTIKDISAEPEETEENFSLMQQGYFITVPARRFIRNDGTKFTCRIQSAKLTIRGRSYFMGVIREISEKEFQELKDRPTERRLLFGESPLSL